MQIDIGEWQVRSLHPKDAPSLAKYANNRKIWINIWDRFPHPYSLQDAENWIQEAIESKPETIFAIASETEVIGNIGLEMKQDVQRRSAEVGYWVGEPFWGQGIATRALKALTEYAFAEFDLARIYAEVFEWNPASCRVLEKAGFEYEGRMRKSATKDGQTIDMFLYSLTRD